MLRLSLLFTSLVLGFAAAQNSTSNFNAGAVDLTLRSQWCGQETNTCYQLCGGKQYTKAQSCDPTTLNFTCTCQNGQMPPNFNMYTGTLPYNECQYTFAACNTANPGSDQCNHNCGNLDPMSVKAGAGAKSTSSSAASSTAASTQSSSAAPAPTTQGKSAAAKHVPEAGFAAVLLGAMGLLL